ncbi:unnamed protein product [Protopolystoma xenopodis]|uniref:Uncharacterized protein n=1 Tax=Protopolystoma xenopodis TaxID=117903 RepID=A0A3S5B2F7_9PLAT|nr:unnamed protein product [Protopolystoma xenopodis]
MKDCTGLGTKRGHSLSKRLNIISRQIRIVRSTSIDVLVRLFSRNASNLEVNVSTCGSVFWTKSLLNCIRSLLFESSDCLIIQPSNDTSSFYSSTLQDYPLLEIKNIERDAVASPNHPVLRLALMWSRHPLFIQEFLAAQLILVANLTNLLANPKLTTATSAPLVEIIHNLACVPGM